MPYMLTLMTLTFVQDHSGSAKEKYQGFMLSATKQAISIKLATLVWALKNNCLYISTTVGLFFF